MVFFPGSMAAGKLQMADVSDGDAARAGEGSRAERGSSLTGGTLEVCDTAESLRTAFESALRGEQASSAAGRSM